MSLERKRISNVFHNAISFGFTLVQSILLVPLLIEFWGVENYGIWITVFSAYLLLTTIDTGHQSYIGNKLINDFYEGSEKLKSTLGSSLKICYLISLLEVSIALLFILSGLSETLLGFDSSMNPNDQWGLIALLLMWLLTGSAGGIIIKLYLPLGLFNRSIWWGICSKVAQIISLLIISYLGGTIFMACATMSVSILIINIFILIDFKHRLPELFPWWTGGTLKEGYSNFLKSLILTFNTILNQLSSSGLIILISSYFQPIAVALFTTTRTLSNSVILATNLVLTPFVPDIIRFYQSRQYHKLNQIFEVNWLVNGIIVNIPMLLILPFIEKLFIWWTKGELVFNEPLYLLLVWSTVMINFGSGYMAFLRSINNLKSITVTTVLRVSIVFSFAFLYLEEYRLVVLGFSIAVSEIICSVILPVYFLSRTIYKIDFPFPKRSLFFGFLPIVITGLCYGVYYLRLIPEIYTVTSSIFLLLVIYYLNWSYLSNDLKERLNFDFGKRFGY